MISTGRRRGARGRVSVVGTTVAAALVVLAACTSAREVSKVDSQPTPPASTLAPQSVDGSTPITAPDPTGLPSVSEPDPDVLIGELPNGLRYLIRDNDSPGGRVEMRLAIDAGSVLEDDTQDGGAHFLEHMLFNGTEEFPENELIAVLRSFGAGFGADVNAYTDFDETVYMLTMPTADDDVVDTGLDVLAQWLTAATIAQADVEAERGVVLDEWRGSGASANGRIFDTLESLFLAGSAYEDRDPIGTDTSISAMDAAPLRAFYDAWYRPDLAGIVVVGDIDPDDIEDGIVERFSSAAARGDSPSRPHETVEIASGPQYRFLADPDVAEGFAQVTLPLPVVDGETPEAAIQNAVLDALAFEMIATRLGNDALRGDAPFDDAWVDSSSIVRALDAPEIALSASADEMEASVQAVFDEYERVRRFGYSPAEVRRAVSTIRRGVESAYDGRNSRQDADFADEYVRYLLTDEPIPGSQREYELMNAILDRATPETIAYRLVTRLAATVPHMMVVVPSAGAGDVPDAEVFLAQAAAMRDRDLEPREDDTGIDGELMEAPQAIPETSREPLTDIGYDDFIDPEVLTFPNGVTVVLNFNEIVEGQFEVEARSQGGLSVLDPDDIPAADAAGMVVGSSGLATHDRVSLDAYLADKDVSLSSWIDVYTEGLYGTAASSDAEVLFQLIHLTMTQPRADEIALDQYLDDEMPYASDPSIDPSYAEFDAMLDARYGDDGRYTLPTVDSLNSVTADDVERVFRDRFGDASDFVFSFSGDVDVDEMAELARRYLGTLPSTGRVEEVDYAEPEPPAGVVVDEVRAGQGEQASVSFLYTAPATTERSDDVLALLVQEVLTARLTDTVREDLGDSYSPFALVEITDGGAPDVQTYISNTTGSDLIDEVVDAVTAELRDLARNGPTEDEFEAAAEVIRQELGLYSNAQINDEVLAVFTDPAGNPSFDDFLSQSILVDDFTATDIARAVERWLPADRWIQVRVLPR